MIANYISAQEPNDYQTVRKCFMRTLLKEGGVLLSNKTPMFSAIRRRLNSLVEGDLKLRCWYSKSIFDNMSQSELKDFGKTRCVIVHGIPHSEAKELSKIPNTIVGYWNERTGLLNVYHRGYTDGHWYNPLALK